MFRINRIVASAAVLAVACLVGPLAFHASAQNAPEKALETLKAGGNTIAGPGLYSKQAGSDAVVQLTEETDVCGTVTLVAGSRVDLKLIDAGGVLRQGVIATPNLRTAAGCYASTALVELECADGPCRAVWRVDKR